MLRKGSDSLRNEPVPFSQPTKICSLGRRLEMQPGERGAGMKMSTIQVGVTSRGQWHLCQQSAGRPGDAGLCRFLCKSS